MPNISAVPSPRAGSLLPTAVVAIALITAFFLVRWSLYPEWEYGQFYLFVWNDRATAGWYSGGDGGTAVERTVVDSTRPQRMVLLEVATELGCVADPSVRPPGELRLVDVLTECLGEEGWELTTATETLHDGSLSPEVLVGRTYLFKRRGR